MAHNIFGERFYSFRKPAWHGLGRVLDVPMTAVQAFKEVGEYDIQMKPLSVNCNGNLIDAHAQAIVRNPMTGSADPVILGVTGPEYQLITPIEVCEIFDQAVGKPVETLGVLGCGETLFVTTCLPEIDVKGDEVQVFLLLKGCFDGKHANEMVVTPVRVVCSNTLIMGTKAATERYRVVHDTQARARMWTWLHEAYERSERKVRLIQEAFDVLASYKVSTDEVGRVAAETFPEPSLPRHDVPATVLKERMGGWEQAREVVMAKRAAVVEVFAGKGVGMDTVAAAGTGWGIYNAAVEVCDYAGRRDLKASAEAALFGTRSEAKARAFGAACAVAGIV